MNGFLISRILFQNTNVQIYIEMFFVNTKIVIISFFFLYSSNLNRRHMFTFLLSVSCTCVYIPNIFFACDFVIHLSKY